MALNDRDRVVAIVPMFHANAWGLPYAAFFSGASLLMPGRFLQAEPLTTMIRRGEGHALGRGADDLGRHPPLRRRARHRSLVDPHGGLRWIGRPAFADGTVRGPLRRAHRAGLGHDRDVAARRRRARARRCRAGNRRGAGLAREDRAGDRRRRAPHRRRRRRRAAVGRRSGG